MAQRWTDRLTLGRKLLLASIGIAVVAGPLVIGFFNAPRVRAQSSNATGASAQSLQVVSLKQNHSGDKAPSFFRSPTPNDFTLTNMTVRSLIEMAYNVNDYQLSGGPSWIDSLRYDIHLRKSGASAGPAGKSVSLSFGQPSLAMQALLADRFQLRLTHENKELPGYVLVVASRGPKLTRALDAPVDTETHESIIRVRISVKDGQGNMDITGPVSALASQLSKPLGRPVLDETGLKGNFDMMLHWPPGPSVADNLSRAVQEQLGLKLKPQQASVPTLVIDQVKTPSES